MALDGAPSLSPLAQDALDALISAAPHDDSFSYERAYTILGEAEDLGQPAAEDILERLLLRGHLYEVEGELRLTEP